MQQLMTVYLHIENRQKNGPELVKIVKEALMLQTVRVQKVMTEKMPRSSSKSVELAPSCKDPKVSLLNRLMLWNPFSWVKPLTFNAIP